MANVDAEVRVLLEAPHQGLDVGHPRRRTAAVGPCRPHATLGDGAAPWTPGGRQRGMRGVLELVELGPAVEQVERPARRCGGRRSPSPSGRCMKRTNTAWSPTMNVGTPHTSWLGDVPVCSPATVSSGRPVAISANTASASTPCRPRARRAAPARPAGARPSSWRSANRARWTARKRVGRRVAHDDADLQGEQAGVVVRVVPDVGLALLDVDLAEREGHERDVPVGAGGQAVEHVLVGVAGEGAAVVPGDGEGRVMVRFNRPSSAAIPTARPWPVRTAAVRASAATRRRADARPAARSPTAAPATTSEAWWIRT